MINKVEPTANYISSTKSGTILLACSSGAKYTAIVSMITVRVLLPSW